MLKAAHQRKFDILIFWALDRLTREGTRATLNYLQRLESKGVGYVSYQEHPSLPEETVQKVLLLNRQAGIGARKIAKSTGFPLGTVNAILTRSRQQTC